MMPRVRITDLLDQVNHWTDFTEHFSHVSTGLPSVDRRGDQAGVDDLARHGDVAGGA